MLCCVVVHASSGNHEAEEYWNAKLPTVAMPEAIKNNLLLWNGEKSLMTNGGDFDSNMGNIDDVIGSNDLKHIYDKKEHEKLSLRAWLTMHHGGVFVEKNLVVGMKLKHQFHNIENAPFLPKEMEKSMPFSKHKFTNILDRLSIKHDSLEATTMNKTVWLCMDIPLENDEKRTCIQSLESMVDYAIKELGTKNLKVLTMNTDAKYPNVRQEYIVTKVKKLVVPGNYALGCHKLSYPYAVYLCHRQKEISQYAVTLTNTVTKVTVESNVICHNDLFAPDVPALRELGIMPGDGPICHLYVVDDIIWTINPNQN
ncbi:unnamed protein product [Amaranthus hypochondriacus]